MRRNVGVALGLFLAAASAHATPIFTDWVSVDTAGDSASGTLGATGVAVSGGDISFAVTDGSSAIFANPLHFTPAIPSGDYVEITGSFTSTFAYTITFSAPVTNPILYVGSLASTFTFSGVTPTRLSGEAEFVVAGSTVSGQSPLSGGNDRNGAVALNGTFNAITFTVDALDLFTNDRDGIALQVGTDPIAVPEPAVSALVGAGVLGAFGLRRAKCRRTAGRRRTKAIRRSRSTA
jgi:hypothetical protein